MIELSNCLWVPLDYFSTAELKAIKKELTVKVEQLDGSELVVQSWRERDNAIGFPRVYGLKLISKSDKVTDKRAAGRRVSFPKQVKLYDEQKPVVEDMLDACEDMGDFVMQAGTGKGKTVMSLAVIQRRGVMAAIVVDQENLMEQWVERATQHLGLTLDDIGIVQGPKATYKGKKLVICMIQTLARRTLTPDFYESFGTVVFDEVHSAGAATYSRALMQFPAEARFGVSATPHRKDAFRKLISWNLGEVSVRLLADLSPSNVYVMSSYGTYSWAANNSKMASRYITEIASDGKRNLLIAKATKWLYDSGRDCVVMSDRVDQLCDLMALVQALGVPAKHMGLSTKVKSVWVYEKDPQPARRPSGWVKGTEYTPVRLARVQKTIRKEERKRVQETAKIMFSTYGIMSKGVDIPRLSGGIDASPRRDATQTVGRILRPAEGKVMPIWITIADENSFRSLYQLTCRLTDYVNSKAEIYLWDMDKGRKPVDVGELKADLAEEVRLLRRSKIVTTLAGTYTLQTPDTLSSSD